MLTITEQEFYKVAGFIHEHYGIRLKKEKKTLVLGRLGNTITRQGFQNFSEYYQYLQSDKTGKAVFELLDKITTNHTFFMREPQHFASFKEEVLPWLEKTVADKDLRIWSAGCSKGQEPYTLAMILNDYFGTSIDQWNTDILATDISSAALKTALQGVYSTEEVAGLPKYWLKKYFLKQKEEKYIVKEELKQQVVFRNFNLMNHSFPFKKRFHVIFCRNVMIYFDTETKKQLIKKFYHQLQPGGYLFIGHSETLGNEKQGFQYIRPATYRRG
ncbi:MCP methyltransferase, CheR-type [Tindallia magadiensis]|uniref:protein-glutamate O-methyltransferase n=1 Tax=Tindallia magadiensis TaxID=69895 RepID=A0A1I3FGZ9_9FIRM|nr:protein-glutamate O-methyltransferase CheR [Tindallia magadiensis]SFI10427.1 MCP methyltransferase, CheR-type [Tindallia magadiensis]